MKKLKLCLYLLAAMLLINNSPQFAQTKNDTLQIKETVINYLDGLDTNDPVRLAKAFHPDLAKRIIEKSKEGKESLSNLTAANMVDYVKDFDFTQFYIKGVDPKIPLQIDVTIYDIANGIATAKAVTNKFEFLDYIQLGKINGEWKIVNILWVWTGNTNKWMNK